MEGETQLHHYGGKTFVVPALSAEGEGLVMRPRPRPLGGRGASAAERVRAPPPPPTVKYREREEEGEEEDKGRPPPRWLSPAEVLAGLNSTWDVNQFESVHPPLVVATLGGESEQDETRQAFNHPGAFGIQRILDMPIKFPGSHEYRLPAELKALAPLLHKVIDFEYAVNGDEVLERYCYLTIDQGVVPAGMMQRNEGCHTDGFQGARITPKLRSDRSYVVSNTLPTVFYLQPFAVGHLDPARHNFFLDFDRQAKEENTWRPAPFEVVLMDAFSVHRGEKAARDTFRTFVRLSYTVRVFDRLGNAHNPMFDYAWEMVPRDTQSTLTTYDYESRPLAPPPPERNGAEEMDRDVSSSTHCRKE